MKTEMLVPASTFSYIVILVQTQHKMLAFFGLYLPAVLETGLFLPEDGL